MLVAGKQYAICMLQLLPPSGGLHDLHYVLEQMSRRDGPLQLIQRYVHKLAQVLCGIHAIFALLKCLIITDGLSIRS
jgi:hypothetical protein